MTMHAFQSALQQLNPRQKEAVQVLEGPVMVVAGPGTGKTQVLTLRIANILAQTDTEPRSILALTFTEKAAYNMRERLSSLIGQEAYSIRISTFHAFANEIIARSPDHFPELIGGIHIEEADQLGVIEALLEAKDIDLLRPVGRPESYGKQILSRLSDIKGKGYTPESFSAALPKGKAGTDAEGRTLQRMRELSLIYTRYEKELTRSNQYDYADMLLVVARALEHDAELRLDLAEQYQYILVDEHQDTNRTQNRIVQLIAESAGEAPNLFVVGDLQQAIYRFQGASPENFRDFAKRYPTARVIRLDMNYRSSQAILDAALGIAPEQGILTGYGGHAPDPAELYSFSTPSVMTYGVTELVSDALEKGVAPGQIAILYRTNRESEMLVEAFEKRGIATAVQSDQEVLDDLSIRKVLIIARAARHIGEDAPLLEALHVDLLNISPLDAAKIGSAARQERVSAWDIIRSAPALKKLNVEDASRLLEVYKILKDLSGAIHNASGAAALQLIIDRFHWVPYVTGLPRGHEVMSKLNALFDAVRAFGAVNKGAGLAEFIDSLERLRRHGSDLAALVHAQEDAVQLMTVHKAKGLEFDLVIIMNTVRGHWGDGRRPPRITLPVEIEEDDPDQLDEDVRRLFYVAITRARKRLIMVRPQRTLEGRPLEPSRFVLSIPKKLLRHGDTADIESSFVVRATDSPVHSGSPALAQKKFIQELFDRHPLSVTALNNFLHCPWKYYFINLVRIPEAPTPKSEYGTAAHEALRRFFGEAPSAERTKASLLAFFKTALARASLPEPVIAQLRRRGNEALGGWYQAYAGSFEPRVKTEVSVERVGLGNDIYVTGKLDKVELRADGTVTVVDYKTKAPMSANAIKGNTKTSTGNEYRQLLFYKILLDRHMPSRTQTWNMNFGVIDFLEPNTSGRYKKESFPISTEMTTDLQEVIKDMATHVRGLSFWNERCKDSACRYCRYRELM